MGTNGWHVDTNLPMGGTKGIIGMAMILLVARYRRG